MKKFVYTDDFKKRFETAAKNGSKVCADIMTAIKTPDNIKDSVKLNYLTTIRVNHGTRDGFTYKSVRVTCCRKDFTNEYNPEKGSPVGMWRKENRSELILQDLVACFKSLNDVVYTDVDFQYAAEILAVDEPLKVVTLKGMENIEKIYNSENYNAVTGQNDTLWNSCMRYPETAAVAGDFYANFCGAKIIAVLGTATNNVYGRAILWPEIEVNGVKGAFLDRVYFTHDAIRVMVWNYAEKNGVKFRKWRNDYSSKKYFVDFSHPADRIVATVIVAVPSVKWHKAGSPYTDTFSFVLYNEGQFYVTNSNDSPYLVAQTDQTGTNGYVYYHICPKCGKVHGNGKGLCRDCQRALLKQTPVGIIYTGKVNKKGEPILPKKFVEDAAHLANL